MASKWKWTRIGEHVQGGKGERVIEESQSWTDLASLLGKLPETEYSR